MNKKLPITYHENELPCEYADRLGVSYSSLVSQVHKKENGQFFTPISIAQFMSSFTTNEASTIRILDPGCGVAILSCSLIEELVKKNEYLKQISLDVYETDSKIIPFTEESLNYLQKWLKIRNISFQYTLHVSDFILDNAHVLHSKNELSLFEEESVAGGLYDIIISNPPYFKLSKDDKRTIAAQRLVSGQPNIYSLFMGVAAKMLTQNGELIFITPRSFASGNYFKAFRDLFFNSVQLKRIHLFNSRKEAFDRDKVLQETVIIKAQNECVDLLKEVVVSSSGGTRDLDSSECSIYKAGELISLHSKEIILHLPTNEKEESVLNLVANWENRLIDYDIYISTGPVVSFRAEEYIENEYLIDTFRLAPLFWLHNVNKMVLDWPKEFKEKGHYVRIEDRSRSILIPNKNYIFLRRFSTKDDKSRLIAAPYFCNYYQSDVIGVENKVNYIYRKKGHLQRSEMVGLCALLNSELFDTYFRIFNGNVNVSATELREMHFPPIDDLKTIGNEIILSNDYTMENVNDVVNQLFNLKLIEGL